MTQDSSGESGDLIFHGAGEEQKLFGLQSSRGLQRRPAAFSTHRGTLPFSSFAVVD